MRKLGLAGIAAALAVLPVTPGHAADYSPPPIIPAGPPPFVELGSNWYLRGDFAYRMHNDVRLSNGVAAISTSGPEDTAALSIGAGYKWGSWLRTDITIDYAFRNDIPANALSGPLSMWSSATFANAYIDLGTWWGVTPYIGAGVGAAYNELESKGRWNFAWAGMAGAAYHMSRNLSIDFGYRYVDLGRANILAIRADDITAHEFRVGFRYLID